MSRGKPTQPKRPASQTTAANLETRFAANKDVLGYFDLSIARRRAQVRRPKSAKAAKVKHPKTSRAKHAAN